MCQGVPSTRIVIMNSHMGTGEATPRQILPRRLRLPVVVGRYVGSGVRLVVSNLRFLIVYACIRIVLFWYPIDTAATAGKPGSSLIKTVLARRSTNSGDPSCVSSLPQVPAVVMGVGKWKLWPIESLCATSRSEGLGTPHLS